VESGEKKGKARYASSFVSQYIKKYKKFYAMIHTFFSCFYSLETTLFRIFFYARAKRAKPRQCEHSFPGIGLEFALESQFNRFLSAIRPSIELCETEIYIRRFRLPRMLFSRATRRVVGGEFITFFLITHNIIIGFAEVTANTQSASVIWPFFYTESSYKIFLKNSLHNVEEEKTSRNAALVGRHSSSSHVT
jgi:hypothetical protein